MTLQNSLCDNCVNTKCVWRAPTGDGDPPVMFCPSKIEKAQTHYDMITNASPEELSKIIVGWLADAAEICGYDRKSFDIEGAEKYAIDWLKSSIEED